MIITAVSRSLIGEILSEDVTTENGGVLFPKNHTFTEEDIEFLTAFKIESVEIEEPKKYRLDHKSVNRKANEQSNVVEQSKASKDDFIVLFDQAAKYMEKLMRDVSAGASIPLMEIRTWLKPLIDQVNGPSGWIMALQPYHGPTNYTYYHMVGVSLISAIIARANRFAESDIMQIALAGLLSDIGKSKVDQKILYKAGPLTPEEYEEMKSHTWLGYQVIKGVKGLSEGVALAALQHHERMDGTGYPLGPKGNQVHTFSKIVAIADVLHAMSSIRVYKDRISPIRAIEQIRYENVGKFDPGLVHVSLRSIAQLPLGTLVRLNDGRLGKMIYVDQNHPTRPIIDVDGEIISLTDNYQLFIEEIIK